MFHSTLFISDLDGTLLDQEGQLSDHSRSGIRQILERGYAFTLASARSHFSIRSIFGELPFVLPIIEFNGAFITDYHSGEHLQINALNEELSHAVFECVLRAGLSPFISSYDGARDRLHFDQLINVPMRWYEERRRLARDPRLQQTADLLLALREQVVSMTVMAESLELILDLKVELTARFGELLRMYCYENEYSRGTFWLTIHDPRASKHIAMQAVRDQFVPGAQITAFGDNHNDVDMIRTADWGVAVENGVDELKRSANEIIGLNTENSVVSYLLAKSVWNVSG